MDKILITNQAGERLEVGVVRFFEYNDTAFLIYTLSEVDANNYVKLYVTKVNVDNIQSITITDEAEWNLFKDVMKGIIKSNKNNAPLQVIDLEPQVINNIVIYDSKVFKLNNEMVNFLQMNKKVSTAVVEPSVEINNIPDVFATPQVSSNENISSEQESNLEANNTLSEENIGMNVTIPELPADMVFNGSNISVESQPEVVASSNQVIDPQESNIIQGAEVSPVTMQTQQEITPVVSGIDYEKAYEEEQAEVNELIQKVAMLENEINNLNAKLDQIKNIIG